MGRYRAPPPKSSPYITVTGQVALENELKSLWQRRTDVTRHLAAAAAEGDRSENAEYIYRKKELREIDHRIRYLQKRIPELKVVKRPPDNRDQVFFGAKVDLEDAEGRVLTLRIVGADEIETVRNYISVDSPMARALLKRRIDDEVTVTSPSGDKHYIIREVDYPVE